MKSLRKITALFTLLLIPFLAAYALEKPVDREPETNIRIIKIKGTDRMKFDVTNINVIPGEKIRLVLTTVSKLPKTAMSHNVVVLKKGTDAEAFANASAMARENDYIAPDMQDKIIAATDLAGGGETVEVTFTVPDEVGSYTYICSFPGHYLAGMKGTLNVKKPSS